MNPSVQVLLVAPRDEKAPGEAAIGTAASQGRHGRSPMVCLNVAPHFRMPEPSVSGTRMQHSTLREPSAEEYGIIKFHINACAVPFRGRGGPMYCRGGPSSSSESDILAAGEDSSPRSKPA